MGGYIGPVDDGLGVRIVRKQRCGFQRGGDAECCGVIEGNDALCDASLERCQSFEVTQAGADLEPEEPTSGFDVDGAAELERPVGQGVEGATFVWLRSLNEPKLGLFEQSSCCFHPWVDSAGTRRLIGCDHDAAGPDAIGDRELFGLPRPEFY